MKILRIIILFYGILFGVVSLGQTINAGNDTIICPGGTASLSAQVSGGNYGTSSYSFQIIPYNPMPFTGGTSIDGDFQGCMASGNDDCWAGPYNIGFNFCFFNQYYSQFWVGSNGWIGFTDPSGHNWTTYTSAPIPNTDPLVPKNCIMAPWEDWFPTTTQPNVFYYVSGTAPNRKLVVYWKDCPMFTCPWSLGTFQIVINEQNSVIENNIESKTICNFHTATQGVHNIDGTIGFTAAGRNSTVWATNNESTRFVPSGISWYEGSYPGGTFLGYGPALNVSPFVTTTYTAVVETCGGVIVTDTVTVNMIDASFNYPQPSYCKSDPDPLPVVLQPGGTFTSLPGGLVFISPVTGQIDVSASLPGNYIVTYTIIKPTCIESANWPVSIIESPGAPVPVENPVSRCGPGPVTLEVVQNPGEVYTWYDAPAGGNLLPYTGSSISVPIVATTQFYPQATNTVTGCFSLTRGDITAVVKPIPQVNNSVLLFNRCSGKSTDIALSSTVPGTMFSWTATASSGNLTGYFDDSGTSIVQTIHNSGTGIDTVYYEVTPEADGCTGDPVIFKVAITPLPILTNTPTFTSICSEEATGITLQTNIAGGVFTWNCTQSSGNITGWAANPGPGSTTINQTLLLSGFITDSVIYHLTPEANGCPGPIADYKVIVNPIPELTVHPMIDSICSEETTNISLTSTIPGTSFSWISAQGVGSVTGNTNNSGSLINDQLINQLTTPGNILYTITPATSTCAGEDTTFTKWVNPLPHLTNTPNNKSICSGQSTGVILESDVTNTLFTWTATGSSLQISGYFNQSTPTTLLDQTLTNSGYDIEWVIYQVTPSAAGCQGPGSNYIVNVFPVPDLSNNPLNKSICSGESTAVNLTSNVIGTMFTWTATASSAFITGFSNNTTNPATAINQTIINSGPDIGWVTYHITPEANGCNGAVVDFTIMVYPMPDLTTNPLAKEICNNNSTNILLTSNVTGTLFTWTAVGSSPNITGYSDNLTNPMVVIDQNLINSGAVNETVTYRIVPHVNGCSGDTSSYVVTTIPSPYLSNNPLDTSICSSQPTGIDLQSNIPGTEFTWVATGSSPQVTGYSNSTSPGTVINQTLVNSGFITETVTYHITPENSGCPGSVTDFDVIVNPNPELTVHPMTDSICSEETTDIQLTSTLPATTFNWTSLQGAGSVTGNTNNSGNLINDQLVNQLTTPGSILYTISPATSTCTGDDSTFTMWVNPMPHLTNTPNNNSICSGQSTGLTLQSDVTNTLFTWTATGSSPQVSGYSDQSTPTILLDQTLTNSGYDIEWVTYQITPSAEGCPGPDSNYLVTVFPVPDLSNNPLTKTICSGEATGVSLTSNVTGTLFTWTATASSALISGFSNNTTNPATGINQAIINSGTDIGWVTYHITPEANGCAGTVTDFTITVYPMPDLTTDPLAKEICNNNSTNILLTSNVTGTLFTWTAFGSSPNITGYSDNLTNPMVVIDQNLINSGSVNETVTYRIVPHANGCSGDTSSYVVTGIPSPYLTNNPLDTSICSSQATGLNLQSNVPGTEFTWVATGSSGLVTGYSNSASPGTVINQTLVNSGFSTETVTYHITPENSGCPGSVTDFDVLVNPIPELTLQSLPDSICSETTTNIHLSSTVNGTSFTWTAVQGVGSISGFSNGNGDLIAQQLVNPLLTPGSVLYTISPQSSACSGNDSTVVQWVKPVPFLTNNPLDTTICSNESTGVALQSNVPGTQFTWTATGSSPQVTGYSNSSSPGTVVNQTLVNTGYISETVTYHIGPENTGCPGPVTDYTVHVFPVPDVYFVPPQETLCEGEVSNLSLLSNVTGTAFNWTAQSSSPDLSGFSDGSGDLIAQVISNSGTTIESVTYQVTPAANGCPPGITMPVVLTVIPRPVITNTTTLFEQCNSLATSISLESDITGSTFEWRAIGSSPNLTGFSNGSGTNIIQTLTNSGYTIETVTYRVAATSTACPGDSTDFEVTVVPLADITFTPNGQEVCSGQSTSLDLQSQVTGTTFSWTATGSDPDVSGYAPGSGSSIQQTLINSGYMLPWVTYQVTPVINGCPGTLNSAIVNVNPLPVVSLTPCFDTITTTDAQPIQLRGGIPRGGLFSGTGVDPVAGTLDPGLAGAGSHQINYTYTNDYSCFASSQLSVTIYQPVAFTCGDQLTDIRDNQTYPTVDINGQCWMAADLNFGNGILSSQMQRDNCVNEKYCYSDNPANCINIGGLYQWDEVMRYTEASDVQGMCPPGWHIPSETEWNILFSFYLSNAYAGDALKTGGSSGFNAQTSGIRFLNSLWKFPADDPTLQSKLYWSSTMHGLQRAWAHGMNEVVANTEYTPSVSLYPGMRNNAFAVRCIRD